MKTLAYIALGLSTAAVMFAGSYLAHLRDRSEVGTSAIGFEGGDGADRDAEVERERQIVLARLAAKLHITQAVIEHKVSLLEAAYQVRELVSTDSRALASLRGAFPDCSEEEMFCRHVITIVPLAPLEKSVAASEVARLEAELRDLLDRDALHFKGRYRAWTPAAKGVNRANTSAGEIAPRLRLCSGAICIR
jgi:hypothetical protein